jgi:DNA mismatch repair protein MutS2
MEPAPAVEMNNRETELAARERELEVQVLARLSAALGRRGRQLAALLAAVTQLDLAAARAAHAAWLGGVPPQFVSRLVLLLVDGEVALPSTPTLWP